MFLAYQPQLRDFHAQSPTFSQGMSSRSRQNVAADPLAVERDVCHSFDAGKRARDKCIEYITGIYLDYRTTYRMHASHTNSHQITHELLGHSYHIAYTSYRSCGLKISRKAQAQPHTCHQRFFCGVEESMRPRAVAGRSCDHCSTTPQTSASAWQK